MYEKELTFEFEIVSNFPQSFTVELDKPWEEMTEDEKRTVIERNWFDAIRKAESNCEYSVGRLFCVRDEETDEEIDCYD